MSVFWIDHNPEPIEPFVGPPKPVNCVAGWTSHHWTFEILDGSIRLSTEDCCLCNDGVEDLEPEYLNASFPVTLQFHKESYAGGDIDVWFEIIPREDEK